MGKYVVSVKGNVYAKNTKAEAQSAAKTLSHGQVAHIAAPKKGGMRVVETYRDGKKVR